MVEEGDVIEIDIPNYSILLAVDEETLAERRTKFEPKSLRPVKGWLKRYRGLVTTSDKGAVLDINSYIIEERSTSWTQTFFIAQKKSGYTAQILYVTMHPALHLSSIRYRNS